jgi:hypothetical protein
MLFATMLMFIGSIFAVNGKTRTEALDKKINVNKVEVKYKAKGIAKLNVNTTLSIGDSIENEGPVSRECEFDWSAYGSANCDTAWDEFGIDCATLEGTYGWDCAGCACPGDVPCEDQGLVTCDFDGSCAASLADCPGSCEDTGDFVDDCSGDGDCCPLSWIGDGYADCEDQQYGCDLTCYDNDGGDCVDPFCGDGSCNGGETEADCPEDCTSSESCSACELDWSAYGSECCDSAWDEFGINCADLEANYGWDCAGCNCPGDAPPECGDGLCNGDETYETCPQDCLAPGECAEDEVIDCSGDGDCCPAAWIGDGFEDCEDQAFGCDLTCYDNDGGDCVDPFCGDGTCDPDEDYISCPDDCNAPGECAAGEVADCDGTDECWTETWIGDGFCDGTAQDWGADLCCYDNDGGDCTEAECAPETSCEDEGLVTCPDGSCAASADDCPETSLVEDCNGNFIDNNDTQYAGDGDSDGDGCMDTVYDCVIDNGTCEDVAGECLDENGNCAGATLGYGCPDGMIGAWTNDTLCDDGDFGLFANCEDLCFDGGACGTQPDPDCTIGDAEPSCPTAGTGDVNDDGAANVLDIVQIVNYILGSVEFDECQMDTADLNGDGAANVLDIVQIVNLILGNRATDATSAKLINDFGSVSIKADGYVGAVQMTLSHGSDFSIELTENALVAEYATEGNKTTLVVVVPENDHIFTANGEFAIEDMIVANSSSSIHAVKATEFSLMAAYPNPFNPSTTLSLNVPADGFVSVKVFNIMGQSVATLVESHLVEGKHSYTWNASDVVSGVYMVRAEYMGEVSTQKLMLLK